MQPAARWPGRGCRWARRPGAPAASWPAPGPPPPAAARRPDSAPGRWSARSREAELLEQAAAARAGPPPRAARRSAGASRRSRAPRTRAAGGGTGRRSPRVRLRNSHRRASVRASTSSPATRSDPASGRSRVPSTCSRVDLPTPEAPDDREHLALGARRGRAPCSTGTSPAGGPVALDEPARRRGAWPRLTRTAGPRRGRAGRRRGPGRAWPRSRSASALASTTAASPGSSRNGTQAIW